MPTHPIATGIPEKIEIPKEEMYGEYFDIPKPDDVILPDGFRVDKYLGAAAPSREDSENLLFSAGA